MVPPNGAVRLVSGTGPQLTDQHAPAGMLVEMQSPDNDNSGKPRGARADEWRTQPTGKRANTEKETSV